MNRLESGKHDGSDIGGHSKSLKEGFESLDQGIESSRYFPLHSFNAHLYALYHRSLGRRTILNIIPASQPTYCLQQATEFQLHLSKRTRFEGSLMKFRVSRQPSGSLRIFQDARKELLLSKVCQTS
jgi:hypothetical protein